MEADLGLDLGALERHDIFFRKRHATEVYQERSYREEQEWYAADTKKLLSVIGTQKQEMESRLSSLSKEHTQVTSNLREGIECRAADYDTQIAKLREESTAALRKQEEMQSLNQALSAEERAKFPRDSCSTRMKRN